jgi:hypothetical protein
MKMSKCIGYSVLNVESNTDWHLGSMSGKKTRFLYGRGQYCNLLELALKNKISVSPLCSKLVNVQGCSTSTLVGK